MLVYRIVPHQYSNDLKGTGASLYGGRWNQVGTAMLYTAQHRSLALCEMMVHLEKIQLKQNYDLITIRIPASLAIKKLGKPKLLMDGKGSMMWNETQALGQKFVLDNKYVGLEVPSAVIPEESNFLFNPMYDDFRKIKIVDRKRFIFDERLF